MENTESTIDTKYWNTASIQEVGANLARCVIGKMTFLNRDDYDWGKERNNECRVCKRNGGGNGCGDASL